MKGKNALNWSLFSLVFLGIFICFSTSVVATPFLLSPHPYDSFGVGPQYASWGDTETAEYYIMHVRKTDGNWSYIKTYDKQYYVPNHVWAQLEDGSYEIYVSGFYNGVKKDSDHRFFVRDTIPNSLYPDNGEYFFYPPIGFGWSPITGAQKYRIGFTMPGGQVGHLTTSTSGNSFTLTQQLWNFMPIGIYHWKVAAIYNGVVYDYSETKYFTAYT